MNEQERKLAAYLAENNLITENVLQYLKELHRYQKENEQGKGFADLIVEDGFLSEQELEEARNEIQKKGQEVDEEEGNELKDPEEIAGLEVIEDGEHGEDEKEEKLIEFNEVEGLEEVKASEDQVEEAVEADREPRSSHPDSDTGTRREDGAKEPIPGYQVIEVLGKGGTGTVFKVEDVDSGNIRALKILYPNLLESPSAVKRFRREGRILSELDHPWIVTGYDHGNKGNLFYQVLEYVDGQTLLSFIREQGAVEEDLALDIILQIADALHHLQEKGYVHRDMKPENVMILEDRSIRILDLGFAKEIGAEPDLEDGKTMGTVFYMSPEQAKGQKELDIRSDIYSLGVTLYHMVMGEVPFEGDEKREIMTKQVRESLKGEEVKHRGISNYMHYLIEKMMSKEKDFRFQSPEECVREITKFLKARSDLEYEPDESNMNPFT